MCDPRFVKIVEEHLQATASPAVSGTGPDRSLAMASDG